MTYSLQDMKCFIYRENQALEPRVSITPTTATRLSKLGILLIAPENLGRKSFFADDEYRSSGVECIPGEDPPPDATLLIKVQPPTPQEVEKMPRGSTLISFLDPFRQKDLLPALAEREIRSICMEMIPRSTLAQKMDALSSQANLAGYCAVLEAAGRIPSIFPMMTTPAGTLHPARVFIVGVGVAGLQAIATAKRLGARVEAFDTRPAVEEQVKSLGAKFVKIDLGETGQTDQGYARELTDDQIARQREGMKKICAQSQVVITTAKLFGRPSPLLITREMIESMAPGSVIVDLAVGAGGNVEGSVAGQSVETPNGVTLCGDPCLEGRVPRHASEMYASNIAHFIEHFWNSREQSLNLPPEDDIIRSTCLTDGGRIVHSQFAS